MEEAKYIREADKSYMSFAIAKDRLLPQYHIKMISENYMEYIIQADTLDVNSELILNYNITSMRALSASIGKNMITSELIKNLIYDLKNMSKEITRYMLDINNICLDTDKIMIDNIRGHFSFIYYPCENKTFIQSMQDLIDDLIQYVDYTDRISVESIYALYGVLRQPNCSFEDMLEVFNNAGINNSNNMVNNNINAMNNANPYGGNNQGNNTEYCFNNAGTNMNSNNIDNNRTGYNDNNSNNSNIYNNTNNSCNNTSYNNSTYSNLNTQYNNTYNNNTSYSDDNNNYNANIYSNDDIYNAINEENNNSHNKKSLKDRFLKNKSKKESNNKAQTDMQSQYGTAQPQQNNINAVTDMQNVDTATSGTIPPTFILSVIALISSVIAAIVIKAYMPRKICLVAAIISAALMVLIYRKNEDAIKNYKFGNRSKNKADKNKEKNNDNNNSYNDMYNNNDWYNNLNNGIDNNTFANNCNNSEYISAYNPSDNNQTFNNNYTNAGMSQNNNIDNQNMSNNYAYDNMPSYEQTTVLREEGTTVLNDCISHIFKESYLEYIDDNERQIYGGNITIRQDNMLIGSSNICDYVIDNPAISRNHARISKIGDKYYMTDLDSTNGTFINGIRMNKSETKELNNGEEVMIGRIKFRFVCI